MQQKRMINFKSQFVTLVGRRIKTVSRHPQSVDGWQLGGNKIYKNFTFKDFSEAKHFLDLISIPAEEQGHHPNISLRYNILLIELTTHAIGGLSENDFIMAKVINEL